MQPKHIIVIVCLFLTSLTFAQVNPTTSTTQTTTAPTTTTTRSTTTTTTKPATTTTKPAPSKPNTSTKVGTTTNTHTPIKANQMVFTKEDSLAAIEELVGALGILYDTVARPYSFGSVNVGIGKGYFTPRSNTVAQPIDKFYYSTSGYYTHKTGFGISAKGLMMPEKGSLTLFQTMLSPSYDYLGSKNWAFGASYTHYFIKDSLSFETSPLTNEYYAYVSYKKSFLRPTLAVNYATGKFEETTATTATTPSISSKTDISDVALIATVQHYFNWRNIFGAKDQFSFVPSLMAVAATSKYGTNLSIGRLGTPPKSYNGNNNGNGNGNGAVKAKKKKKKDNDDPAGGTPVVLPPTTEESITKTDFALQGLTLIMGANYAFSKFYLQPQLLLDYTVPQAAKKFNILFNATLGVNF